MSSKYVIQDHQALHLITFATVDWVDALSRPAYKDLIVDSLQYCIANKGLMWKLVLYLSLIIMYTAVPLIMQEEKDW